MTDLSDKTIRKIQKAGDALTQEYFGSELPPAKARAILGEGALALGSDHHPGRESDSHAKQENLSDLMGNLMHYCDREDLDLQAALRKGRRHYEAEKDAADDEEAFENYQNQVLP